MRCALISCILLLVVGLAAAEVPPLRVPMGEMVENISCFSDPTQTYTLYMPSTYSNDRRLPVLMVFDPRGRSLLAAELFREAAETYGWIIISSDNTRSDGSWEPNVVALQALWPEVHARLPADAKRIYAAGFSGGAAVAALLSRTTRKVAGIVACGGRVSEDQFEDIDVPVFSTAGDTDFNFLEMHRLVEYLAEMNQPHRLVIFEGAHTWMPPAVAREAIEWFELLAMRGGARDRDPDLVESLFASDLAKARALAENGQLVDAERRLRDMEYVYAGLHDTSEAKRAADRIEAGDEHRLELKRAGKARNFEQRCKERESIELSLLGSSDIPPPTRQLAENLRIRELERSSGKPGAEGLAAQRCLNSLYSVLSFYLPLAELPDRRYAQVATSYELSLMIRDDNPVVWYNLGCVRSLVGQKSDAVKALDKALELGFSNYELLATDTDLDPLRERDDFKALMAEIPPSR
jgi:predicted esterase